MGFFKKVVKHKPSLVWSIVTVFTIGVMVTANILASNNFYTLISNVFGGPRAITASGTNDGLYTQDFDTKEEAYANGNAVSKEICEEGMVLLKNENALPLKADAKVSVFGKNSVNLVTGGSGSAAPKQDEPVKTIFDSLDAANIAYNPTLKAFYENNDKSGPGRPENPTMNSGGAPTLDTGETPVASYTSDITGSYMSYRDAALVVFSRIAGENWDLPRRMAEDASHHYLQLDSNERALLQHVCNAGFEHVIVLINSSNNIDLGFLKFPDDPAYQQKIDGAILIGSVGAQGIMALGEILNGTVNPSGHTVDTLYTKYENDPTWQNFGDNLEDKGDAYLKPDGKKRLYYFVDYEEAIYYGYRYYETRGHVEGEDWYNANVVYPFGHGLSYTTFSEELVNKSHLESTPLKADEKFNVEVRVENTGNHPGKHVVQLYVNAPYTEGGIEKPYKVLAGFAKTKLLKPNEKDTVTIEVDPYLFASYDCYDKNGNGNK
ncbi:MAG: glycoside hydrolase family 3 C-terminal domain-containing protein, partial [Bacilli bacterium]|nr:glycoside hydrolase family 3 C-terminal domain-containing protein [Bacilli bacterium]